MQAELALDRFPEVRFDDLPGVRLIEWLPRGVLWATLSMKLRYGAGGQMEREAILESEEIKAKALNRVRRLWVEGDIVFAASGASIQCRRLEDLSPVWSKRSHDQLGFLRTSPMDLGVNRDGRLVVSYDDGSMELISPEGDLLRRRSDNSAPLWIAMNRDLTRFAGAEARSVGIWDALNLTRLASYPLESRVYAFAAALESDLALIRTDGRVEGIRLSDGETLWQVPVKPGVPALDVTADGSAWALIEQESVVVHRGDTQYMAASDADKRPLSIKFAPDGSHIAVGWDEGSVTIHASRASG